MAIPLGRPLPNASCDRPERRREGSPGAIGSFRDACRSYLVLLPVGFSLPPPLPAARCALTAPFHPCRPPPRKAASSAVCFCGTFPGVAPAGRYPAPYLRGARTFLSPRNRGKRPSDRLAREMWADAQRLSKPDPRFPWAPQRRNWLHRGRACFETRPLGALSMREAFDGIKNVPHSEEAAQRLSRRT